MRLSLTRPLLVVLAALVIASPATVTAALAANVIERDAGTDPLLAPSSACPGQLLGAYETPGSGVVRERALRCLINYAREQHGRTALSPDPHLRRSAARRTQLMDRCHDYSHEPCGQGLLQQVRGSGFGAGRLVDAAEDLAWGYADSDDRPRDAMLAWLRSPDHRSALLDRRYRSVGVSIRPASFDGDDGVFVVANFGRTRNVPAR